MVLNYSDNDMILVYQYKSGNNLEFTRKRTAINQHYYASYIHVFKSRIKHIYMYLITMASISISSSASSSICPQTNHP